MLALIEANSSNDQLFAIVRDKKLRVEPTVLPFLPKRYKR
jgi:hypothetical protein